MHYLVAIEPGNEQHAFGVVVPDLPGCFSAGDTLEEALANAREAIILHLEALLDSGEPVPAPSDPAAIVAHREMTGWIWATVDVPTEALDTSVERVNVTIPRRVLRAIDRAAGTARKTRSAYVAEAAFDAARRMARQSQIEPAAKLGRGDPSSSGQTPGQPTDGVNPARRQ